MQNLLFQEIRTHFHFWIEVKELMRFGYNNLDELGLGVIYDVF